MPYSLKSHLTHLQPVLLSALLAVGAVGATTAFAQSATPGAAQTQPQAHHGMRHDHGDRAASPERMQQHMARRTADLKARLKIEPAQESAWTSFTEAMKPPADRMQRRQAIHAESHADRMSGVASLVLFQAGVRPAR